MSGKVILESQGVSKRFGDYTAVDKVSYQVREGEAAGIIGPNGAGKTTFFNLLTGLFPPSEGTVRFLDHDITSMGPDQRVGLGIVRTFQLVSVFDTLSVLDNLILAVVRSSGEFSNKPRFLFGPSHPKHVEDECRVALEMVGIADKSALMTSNLSYGDKRKLEIALALALKPRVLLLDEPLAGLSDAEIIEVMELMKQVQGDLTMVIIEHKISQLVGLVSRLSVMHEGRLIIEGEPEEILSDPTVRHVYWGEDVISPTSGPDREAQLGD
ncbi:MAG: ABC transporter ATP-binding protein [bacterium]|nr:ABC transporter ATP-binding protein [bacterium]